MKRAVLLLSVLVMTGCASQQDLNSLKWEVDSYDSRIAKMEADLQEKDRLLRQNLVQQAELQVTISDLRTQVQMLQGQIEELSAPPAAAPAQPAATQPEESKYDRGLYLFRNMRFSDAVVSFEEYLEDSPEKDLIDNSHFWIGEALYAMGRYEDAILKYDWVIKKYPESDKVPASLLKQGSCFMKLGDDDTGKLIMQKLVKQYPKSESAQKAKKILGG